MERDSESDLLSELPQSILETILTKLPIRDAVRTSILSSRWRYKWASLTHLVFDDRSTTQYNDRALVQDRIVNFITRFLFLHDGPIHKFFLTSSYLETSPDIDQWMLFISRKDVKELVLELGEGEWFRAPSSIFSCKNLTRLELVRCELNPPVHFKGFLFLKYLNLQQVLIPPEDIEYLISSCPLLESLTLSYFDSLELTVSAPNLKFLILEGEFKDLCLINTPLLVAISVAMYMTDDIAEHFEQSSSCNFDKFLGGVPKLERLIGHIYFTKYLSIGNSERHNRITYHNLKFVELYQVSFDDWKEVLVVLQLIVNSPNLEVLQISGSSNPSAAVESPDFAMWEEKISCGNKLNSLRTVKLSEVCGVPLEMKFIKFLLEHSHSLEEMSITPSLYATQGKLNMLIDLVSFRRASPRASITFIHEGA
ncbi:F-box/FBD/LRR-repeat protein At1g13570 [Andrographis paniculata]|uniref:F-box/FBD/LRR-repeat protein At1g13570 n=1 Tax=Andrographis paniculata TaxID=175694 RepID=UPI0021E82DA7|nr:F-box/FBD/LRR-repeat protein At1g13570 [Andrographis paniculata]XP_051122386.1 F-box/FBD/LRR-repeat protein At1g13570 [Andrographis paniculata]XP_051122387.1 F-box/FBD/LRR-repeat protein At1g13570 [Andrographis paniculata]XP_051122388.1 F-box/FBD/LRR-repeat protein At1g13570 [Andrographis paniculata]